MDGVSVLQGTHLDWHRYEVITRGPSWDQAETLRQAIVAKNAVGEKVWQARRMDATAAAEATDAAVAQLEADLARLKRPVPRVYEIVRTGEAAVEPLNR